ncbi:hypothetical protein QTP86_014215, partial [Hemibagrus guttatus]
MWGKEGDILPVLKHLTITLRNQEKDKSNYLPDVPDGQDASSLEIYRQDSVDEMKKKNPYAIFISQRMDLTDKVPFRRKEVVINKPPISQMLQCWPELFLECLDSADEDSYQHVPVGILSKESEDVAQHPLTFQLHTSSVGIILE